MADAYQMFIDGEWASSSDGQTRDVINPATGEVLASVQEGTKEDADRAVAAAKRAFEGDWFDSTPKDRHLVVLKFADRI
jgi:acyl-CoA reductase-like NAD-dependent aldehyde dehydrogenase